MVQMDVGQQDKIEALDTQFIEGCHQSLTGGRRAGIDNEYGALSPPHPTTDELSLAGQILVEVYQMQAGRIRKVVDHIGLPSTKGTGTAGL